ncbi:MAG: bifunctional non-ous end joining protein LigD [Acidobacteriota bacterium]|jgi:bifunctional non-homologous end joining protein LigD
MKWREPPETVRPMLATLADPPLVSPGLVYEPKYDGIRALVHVPPAGARAPVRIWSRLGNEKTSQFPSIVRALDDLRATLAGPLLIDGEIVALDSGGRPAGFQRLQGRIHLTDARDVQKIDTAQPVALVAFDLLRAGDDDLRGLPLTERRRRLEQLLAPAQSPTLRISEQVAGDGRALEARARAEGWEGLIVKEARAPYQSGRRSPAWRKWKLLREQEFLIGGWTEPRQTRQYFGALLLGVRDDAGRALEYVGHTGTGFNGAELARVWKLLKVREIAQSPFSSRIKTNEPAHWVRPDLVAQVRFTEWTSDNKLRHPVYLGLRDDKRAADVVREEPRRGGATPKASAPKALREAEPASTSVQSQLQALEDARRDGTVDLPDGTRLAVTNLAKVYWPEAKITKGALLRYYADVAPLILPAVADRPLVMKRFPNGVGAPAFYQQRSRQEKPPAGVRVETLPQGLDPISEPDARRFVGGTLITLLYMTQIAAISQDPWFSRVQSPLDADYVALDLDPGDDTPFDRVLDVARWIRDELASLRVPAVPKTSGSSGLHVYVPLPRGTSYESGMLFCQIVATVIASRHPRVATVERTVRARPRGTVYVDFLQNILGKTLATAYSARASSFAGVSTPLRWEELDEKFTPQDFTILTAPARFRQVGDLWARLRTAKPADLETVFRKYQAKQAGAAPEAPSRTTRKSPAATRTRSRPKR